MNVKQQINPKILSQRSIRHKNDESSDSFKKIRLRIDDYIFWITFITDFI